MCRVTEKLVGIFNKRMNFSIYVKEAFYPRGRTQTISGLNPFLLQPWSYSVTAVRLCSTSTTQSPESVRADPLLWWNLNPDWNTSIISSSVRKDPSWNKQVVLNIFNKKGSQDLPGQKGEGVISRSCLLNVQILDAIILKRAPFKTPSALQPLWVFSCHQKDGSKIQFSINL